MINLHKHWILDFATIIIEIYGKFSIKVALKFCFQKNVFLVKILGGLPLKGVTPQKNFFVKIIYLFLFIYVILNIYG